jgi:hypothetical protein
MKELPKAYEASQEKETYKKWEETGLFNPDNMERYLKEKGT